MYLTCLNCDSGDPSPLRVQLRPSDGKFFASLEPCSDYKLTFKEGEKTIRQETFNTECEDGYQEIKKNITLDLNKGTTNSLTLNGKVTSQSGEPIPAEVQFNIQCIDCKDATKQQVYLDPKTGEYSTNLKPCHSYKISFSKEGKEFYKETFKTNCDTTLQTKNIQLDKYLINTSENKEYAPLAIKHYFGYNHNRINPNSGNLKSLFSTMGEQTKKGRNEFTLYVEASASKVTTSSFKNNQALAQTRADNIVQLLKQHLSTLPKLKGKVEIKVKSASVNGPTYHRGDYVNKQKYIPYQYVIITLKGKNSKEKVKIIKSKDKVIDNMPQK